MRILIIVNNLYGNGGTERAISNLLSLFFGQKKYEFQILSIIGNNNQQLFYDFPCEVDNLNHKPLQKSLYRKLLWYITLRKKLKHTIAFLHPDVILSYGHNVSVIMPLVIPPNIRTFACEHINYYTIPRVFRLVMRLSYRRLSGVIVLSQLAKEKIKGINKNIIIIPNSISYLNTQKSNLQSCAIIMVGRLSKEKGYERLFPIVHEFMKKHIDIKIHIYGDGDMFDDLSGSIKKNNFEKNIILEGRCNEIQKVFMNASLLLMTSYSEALPMAIIEAKAFGVPTIAYECEGTCNLIQDGVDGYLVKSNDSQTYAQRINELRLNDSLRKKMGNAAFINAKKYSPEMIKQDWVKLLQN